MDKRFTHLHVHSIYSLLDGYNKMERLVQRLKELGMAACALTDHNELGGVPSFVEACRAGGIKPLIGNEGYYTPSIAELSKSAEKRKEEAIEAALADGAVTEEFLLQVRKKKVPQKELTKIIEPYRYDTKAYHILYIAKNDIGWHNLVKLTSEAARLCTFNGRHHADMDLIRKYHEGLICTCACISSYPSVMIQKGNFAEACKYLKDMLDIFGEDFYLEIQPLDKPEQRITNLYYMNFARRYDVKCVATNDAHWTYKEDWDDHDTLLCIGTGAVKADSDRLKYSNDFWVKSYDEMVESFAAQSKSIQEEYEDATEAFMQEYEAFYLQALSNTNEVAGKVEDDIRLNSDIPLIPHAMVPEGLTAAKYFSMLAFRGMYKYLAKNPELNIKKYEKRLAYELSVIIPKGFADYFLTVREYVTWANEHDCPTGPGRGSAAGSLVLFSLGITKNIDPIKNGLWFSRFMTPDRTEMPDIDVDFEYTHRDSVVHHLEDYYGLDHVAHIGTYSELGVKSGIKDIMRVFGISFEESNKVSKEIDAISDDAGLTFATLDAMKDGDENEKKSWAKFHDLEMRYEKIFELARRFEGIPRQMGIHASGILVTPCPVTDFFPVHYKDGTAVALYPGPMLEELGAVKYDLLGLKNISIITKTLASIDNGWTIEKLYETVKLDDKKLYKYISGKQTRGIFQLSSDMMQGLIDKIKPTEFNDLIAINSIGRPGPISAGLDKSYAKGKHEGEFEYPIRGCEDILDETYGCTIYQEQLMAISREIAGFDDGQADSITRKIIAKKKKALFPMMLRCHKYGKLNCEGPAGWEEDDKAPWYDPEGKYGKEIKGAIANGYTAEEVDAYFDKIMGFADYAFNKSHAACYSYLGLISAWLKVNYPTEFMASLLTMADEKVFGEYMDECRRMGIEIACPDINISQADFTPDGKKILYGLNAVKGVGDTSVPELIAGRPYRAMADAVKRLSSKAFNKRIAEALIKAGAWDFLNSNRLSLLNGYYSLKGLKENKQPRFDEAGWNKELCMEFEKDTLGAHITYHDWFEGLKVNQKIILDRAEIISVKEHHYGTGKNNIMAFVVMHANDVNFEAVIFAREYRKLIGLFYKQEGSSIMVSGSKSEKGSFVISGAGPCTG